MDHMGMSDIEMRVLRFTVRRGARVGVTKEDYLRGLGRELMGIKYNMLEGSLRSLERNGLITMSWIGIQDFIVHPTRNGLDVLRGLTDSQEETWTEAARSVRRCTECGTPTTREDNLCEPCADRVLAGGGTKRLQELARTLENRQKELKEKGQESADILKKMRGLAREIGINVEEAMLNTDPSSEMGIRLNLILDGIARAKRELEAKERNISEVMRKVGRRESDLNVFLRELERREGLVKEREAAVKAKEEALRRKEGELKEEEERLRRWAVEIKRMRERLKEPGSSINP